MIVGFTGTRSEKLPVVQKLAILRWLRDHKNDITEFHQGDCVGADAFATDEAYQLHIPIVTHPPDSPALRNFWPLDKTLAIRDEKPYLMRNRDIVDECYILLAMPEGPETARSGTWSTVRYAQSVRKPYIIFWPDGEITDVSEVPEIS